MKLRTFVPPIVSSLSLVSYLSFAIAATPSPANTASQSNENQTQEARLGIGVASLPEVLKSHLSDVLNDGRGILVSQVMSDSPAAKAGIRKHDVLVRYGDQDLYSPEQLVKRVRNDDPGSSIELQFVRSGKMQNATVELGAQDHQRQPVHSRWSWPNFAGRFDMSWAPLRPEYWAEAQDVQGDGTEWTSFESLTVKKETDGSYSVSISYKDTSGNSIGKQFKGKRQEIRNAIDSDNDLPEIRKKQLLRTLDDRGREPLAKTSWGTSWGQPWRRDLLRWPGVDF